MLANVESLSQIVLYFTLILLQGVSLNSACISQTSCVNVIDLSRRGSSPGFQQAWPHTIVHPCFTGSVQFIMYLMEPKRITLMLSKSLIIHAVDSALTILYADSTMVELQQTSRIGWHDATISLMIAIFCIEEDTTVGTVLLFASIQLALLMAVQRIETLLVTIKRVPLSHLNERAINLNSLNSKLMLFPDVCTYCTASYNTAPGEVYQLRWREPGGCGKSLGNPEPGKCLQSLQWHPTVASRGSP